MGTAFHIPLAITSAALRRPFRAELAHALAAAVALLEPAERRLATLYVAPASNGRFGPARPGTRNIPVCMRLPNLGAATATQWLPNLQSAVDRLGPQFLPVGPVLPVDIKDQPPLPMEPMLDLRLRFITPLVHDNTADELLNAAAFIALVRACWQARHGREATFKDDATSLQLLAHLGHTSAAVRGGQAFEGTLFLRGTSPALLAVLTQLQGSALVHPRHRLAVEWRGAFDLSWQRCGWLDLALASRRRLAASARLALDRDDLDPVPQPDGAPADALTLAQTILAQVGSPHGWTPQPSTAWVMHRTGHAPRMIEKLQTMDLVLQQHVLRLLQPIFERLFHPASHGFRPGRGRETAMATVRAGMAAGHVFALKADISQCFASVDHGRLLTALDRVLPRADRMLRALLAAVIAQPFVVDGQQQARTGGLAQGAPLSPLLVNLFLTPLDHSAAAPRWVYVRFADDFIVLTRSRRDATEALAQIESALETLGLALAPHKTQIAHIDQGFDFLGEHLDKRALEPVHDAVAAQRKPLLVTEPYLHLGVNGAALQARRGAQLVGTWPLRRLSGLLILARCNLSSTLLERCSTNNIPIAISLRSGKQIAVMVPNQRSAQLAQHKHACWHEALSAASRLALAQAVVQAKLNNVCALVQQRDPSSTQLQTLRRIRHQSTRATTTEALRGHEGAAARLSFGWLQQQLLPGQAPAFTSRRRARGAPDRLNSVLNLGYYLLFTRLNAMVRLVGLNPYLGWLHDGDDDYETLVYDLMEPFRPFVDRLILRQINRQALRAQHFETTPGQHRLTREAVREFAEAFEYMLGEKVGNHRLRDLLWTQVRSVAAFVAGRSPLWLFHWHLRAEDATTPIEATMLTLQDDPWVDELEVDPEADTANHLASVPQRTVGHGLPQTFPP